MELRQLEYLVAVAEEANFTRAAARVHISQSGVSAQIRQLERELGATLIDRSGRTATLTAAGAAAVEHAIAALRSVEALGQAVDEINDLIRGRLVVGMVTGCTIVPLFDALATFHLAHPGVEVALVEDNSDRLIEGVRRGDSDLALVATAGAPPEGLESFTIVRDGLIAVVAPEHPLARRRRAALADVCGHPIVSLPLGTGIRTVLDQSCAAQGLEPKIALEASAPDAVVDLAVRGFGVAILAASMATGDGRSRVVPIRDVETPAVLALAWRRTKSPALGALLLHAHQAFTTPGEPGEQAS